MAVTTTTRIPVTRWSASATDPFTRAQMDASHAAVDLYAARDEQGLDAAKPAPAIRGRWWFSTDTRKRIYRDDGTTLHELPLIAQQNDHTAVNTFALASESGSQATATNAPLGVTRPTATGHKSYFALAKAAVTTWALGVAGTVADGSGETNALIWGAPDASMGMPTPLMYLGTSGTLRNVGTSYSGPYAAGTAGTTRTASGQFDANNAQVAAQGANTNVGLIVSTQGTGAFDVRPGGTTVLTVAPTLITAAQKVTITAGGLDVAGSPSGYGAGELRFPTTTASASAGISTLATGSPVMQSDHRGTTNTGSWSWNNGTSGATNRMTLGSTGNLTVTGKITAAEVGTATGAGTTPGAVAFGDNDSHTWEGGGSGQWYFRNAANSTSASFTFFGGVSGIQLLAIEAGGHLVTGGANPTVFTGFGAGWSVAVVGNDTAGTVTLTNNTAGAVNAPALSSIATVTFSRAYASAPKVLISPVTSFAVAAMCIVGAGTTTFSISSTVAVATTNGSQFTFNYHVLGL